MSRILSPHIEECLRLSGTVIQGITFILAVSVGVSVLVIDLIYPRLDPRVTYVAEKAG